MENYKCLGLMSGTSLDGIDAALMIIWRAGAEIRMEAGATLALPYTKTERAILRDGLDAAREIYASGARKALGAPIEAVARLVTDKHIEAVAQFRADKIDLIGFHGQTLWHAPEQGETWQIGDAQQLADATQCAVVGDFRQADIKAGGQGAPLAPIYHRVLCREIEKPCAVLNIGGVANITYIGRDGDMLAFDTGPGNALLDDWVMQKRGASYDKNGALAAQGKVSQELLQHWTTHQFFAQSPPKSLDRLSFADITEQLAGMTVEDGAATLTAFTAAAVRLAQAHLPSPPHMWIVCGGGRHNPTLMAMLADALEGQVRPCEDFGWRGDFVEAEAFALLAALCAWDSPATFPTTTGVREAVTSGSIYRPSVA